MISRDNSIIESIVPGDYDGDSVMDLLVVSKTGKMSLFLGDKKSRYTNDLRKRNGNLFHS